MIGNFVGGWGAEELGWRTTFILVGVPGIFVALLIWFTLREPPRGMADAQSLPEPEPEPESEPEQQAAGAKEQQAPNVSEVLSLLWGKVSFRHLSFAAGLHAFVGYGAGTWNAPFLIRSHDMAVSEVGTWLAFVAGVGAIGTFLGGYLGDKLSERFDDRRWYMWVPGYSTIFMVPFQFVAYLYGGIWAVIPALVAVSILGGMYLGPSFAMTQGLVTLRMRAVASAILLFMLNIIGMGLGPFLVGIFSDVLNPSLGVDSLRYALCLAVLANIWAAVHYFVGAQSLRQDLSSTEAVNAQLAAA